MNWPTMEYYREVDRLEGHLLAIGFQAAHIRALKRECAADFIFKATLALNLSTRHSLDPDKITVALLYDADLVAQEPTSNMVNALNDTLIASVELVRLRSGVLKDEIKKVVPFLK